MAIDSDSHGWLVLLHQLPAQPPYLRVKVWRRLQAIGAASLKNAVHALPQRPDTRRAFETLLEDIVANGGEAVLIEARLLAGQSDVELRALFDAARDADYDELARDAQTMIKTGPTGGAEIGRLRKRLDEIARLDFFGAHGQQVAEAALRELEERRYQHPDVGRSGELPAFMPTDLKSRTWVTRKHVHVDRIASAWLIRRFIDADASFKFVDGKDYVAEANELRFDMAGAEFTHEEDRCSFETLVLRTGLDDPALGVIGEMIHELDIADGKYEQPETAGLGAMLGGICASIEDDLERIASGSQALDQLHAYLANRKPAK